MMLRLGNQKGMYPEIANRINEIFDTYLAPSVMGDHYSLIPDELTQGKAYEAYVLSLVVKELSLREHLTMTLTRGRYIELRSSGGPINRGYPHIRVDHNSRPIAEIWTDIEFAAYSCINQGRTAKDYGDIHELDILMTDFGAYGFPTPEQIWLGVECKHTGYGKGLLKEILGVRRELGLLACQKATKFSHWPRTHVPADPPCCLLVYSSDEKVKKYSAPGRTFGIDFYHQPFLV